MASSAATAGGRASSAHGAVAGARTIGPRARAITALSIAPGTNSATSRANRRAMVTAPASRCAAITGSSAFSGAAASSRATCAAAA